MRGLGRQGEPLAPAVGSFGTRTVHLSTQRHYATPPINSVARQLARRQQGGLEVLSSGVVSYRWPRVVNSQPSRPIRAVESKKKGRGQPWFANGSKIQ